MHYCFVCIEYFYIVILFYIVLVLIREAIAGEK